MTHYTIEINVLMEDGSYPSPEFFNALALFVEATREEAGVIDAFDNADLDLRGETVGPEGAAYAGFLRERFDDYAQTEP